MIGTGQAPDGIARGDNIGGINDHDEVIAEEANQARPRKSAEAFRTISEVADELNVPQHVLRFWETKFPRIKPLKRGGGRRYYRPEDVMLLRRIANFLYTQGYTIKGVQRLLKESSGLLDDIPAGTAGEQAATGQEDSMAVVMPADNAPGDVSHQPPRPAPPPEFGVQAKEDAEVLRLRGVLAELLQALEALRASLR